LPTGGEALAPGCFCEGWGIGDLSNLTHVYGVSRENTQVNVANGTATLTVSGSGTNGLSTGSSALSVVDITMGGNPWAQVRQDYHPAAASNNLYEDSVTIKNTGTAPIGNLIYRRAMDWDIPPTEFNEHVTLQGWPAGNLLHSSDDGFHSLDINDSLVGSGIAANTEDQNFTNSGPDDHGAAFDFSFGSLAPGASKDFKVFYGAAGNPVDALNALKNVGAEVYSLGMPSNFPPGDAQFGTPNTFIFGFAGVGGTPVGGAPVLVSTIGEIRQLSRTIARLHADAIWMRMDGLDGGGDRVNFNDDAARGLKIFAMAGMVHGALAPYDGAKGNFNLHHIDGGVDYTFGQIMPAVTNFRVGAAIGTAIAETGSDLGTTFRFERIETHNDYNASVYASARLYDRGYVQGIATVSSLSYLTQRFVGADDFSATAHNTQYRTAIRFGYDFPMQRFLGSFNSPDRTVTVGPMGEMAYDWGRIRNFQETGSNAASALIFPDVPYHTWSGQLGARAAYAERIGTHTYGLVIKAAWEHQFQDENEGVLANSVGSLPSLAGFDIARTERLRAGARIFLTGANDRLTVAVEDEIAAGPNGHENAVSIQGRFHL